MEKLAYQQLFCYCLAAIFPWSTMCSTFTETQFVKTPLCNAQDRIDNACFVQMSARSRLECLASCSSKVSCDNILVRSTDTTCYHGTTCTFVPACSVNEHEYSFYVYKDSLITTVAPVPMTTEPEGCQNGGVENLSTGDCDCTGTAGYVGSKCHIQASDCGQLKASGFSRKTYPIFKDLFGDGSFFFKTYCEVGYFSHTFEVLRSTGSFDKTLTYNDYVNGFHLGPNDFFVGLEALHRYTSDGGYHTIKTQVSFYSSKIEGQASKGHNNFVVQSASSGYQYTCDGPSSSSSSISVSSGSSTGFGIDDMLSSQRNIPFSTADHDVDNAASRNCAQLAHAGWWFDRCSPFKSNPLGLSYSAKPGSTTDSHFHVPGLDMSRSNVQQAFEYFTLHLNE